jgi:predicted ATP-dependent Lon-type protease
MSVALSANGGWLGRLKLDAQHRDFQDLIAAEPMAPGSVYTTSVTGDGMVGLYRLEVSISAGNCPTTIRLSGLGRLVDRR